MCVYSVVCIYTMVCVYSVMCVYSVVCVYTVVCVALTDSQRMSMGPGIGIQVLPMAAGDRQSRLPG